MDIKSLNNLAKACRRLGITHLKTDEVEIDLANAVTPAQARKRRTSAPVNESLFEEKDPLTQQKERLSDMDLLFWSAGTQSEPQ